MIQLAIDTSSDICSVALVKDNELLKELSITDNKTHSENLMPLIDNLFNITNMSLEQVDFFSCYIGPRFFYWNPNWYCYCKGF